MTGLILKLAPKERVLINGAVIENGDRRSRLNIVTPGANILRLKDAIHPEHANTPVRRLCYAVQLALSGDQLIENMAPELLAAIAGLSSALEGVVDSDNLLSDARRAVVEGQPYQALKALRQLLPLEAAILGSRVA